MKAMKRRILPVRNVLICKFVIEESTRPKELMRDLWGQEVKRFGGHIFPFRKTEKKERNKRKKSCIRLNSGLGNFFLSCCLNA